MCNKHKFSSTQDALALASTKWANSFHADCSAFILLYCSAPYRTGNQYLCTISAPQSTTNSGHNSTVFSFGRKNCILESICDRSKNVMHTDYISLAYVATSSWALLSPSRSQSVCYHCTHKLWRGIWNSFICRLLRSRMHTDAWPFAWCAQCVLNAYVMGMRGGDVNTLRMII